MKKAKSQVSTTTLKRLKDRLVIVRVGNNDRPADPNDIKDMKKKVRKALKGVKCRILVTHHAMDAFVL